MNACELHDRLTKAHSELHNRLAEADEMERDLPIMKKENSEFVYESHIEAIKKIRAECKTRVFEITGMRAALRQTHVKVEVPTS